MNGPVLGAIITSGVALLVAIAGGLRRTRQAFVERRYERRQDFLVEAQDAMLTLRDALATYGVALQEQLHGDADLQPTTPGVLVTGPATAAASSFVLAVPQAVSLQVAAARGRLAVARSRIDDATVIAALQTWETLATASMIDPHDIQTSAEEAAFGTVNELIHAALHSSTGKSGR